MEQYIERLRDMLDEARLQIEYLHNKFQKTGTGETVIAQINALLQEPVSAPSVPENLVDKATDAAIEYTKTHNLILGVYSSASFVFADGYVAGYNAALSSQGARQIAGVQWVKGAPRERKLHYAKFKQNPLGIVYQGIIKPLPRPGIWNGIAEECDMAISDSLIIEYLDESSSLSTAAKEQASLSPKNTNDIGLTEALDYVEKYVGSCNDDNLVMCTQTLNAFMAGVEFMIRKEQETAIDPLLFHSWMIDEGWTLHSSREYYYRGKQWPPKQSDMCEIADLVPLFLQSQTK